MGCQWESATAACGCVDQVGSSIIMKAMRSTDTDPPSSPRDHEFFLGSKNRLTLRSLALFDGETLFHRIARALCRAECICRKELFESWEVARRVRRRFRGGRVVDLCAGHGLVGQIMLLLDDT